MAYFSSFGTSFGPAARGICPAEEALRLKDDVARSLNGRVAKLPEKVRAWRGKVEADALDMLALVHREYERVGYVAVPLNAGNLAEALGTTADDARRNLATPIKAGAVIEEKKLRAPPIYKPEMTPPALSFRRDPVAKIGAAVERVNDDLARLEADLHRPSPRGDHTGREAAADLHDSIDLCRRD